MNSNFSWVVLSGPGGSVFLAPPGIPILRFMGRSWAEAEAARSLRESARREMRRLDEAIGVAGPEEAVKLLDMENGGTRWSCFSIC